MRARYDTIGLNYANLRQPDPRIAERIARALGDAQTVLNVGAGAGSYEPAGPQVTAVEPSAEMIAQRPKSGAKVVQAKAENLPFADDTFDASMAVLTIHHWTDVAKGLTEMRRVTQGKLVFLTYDPSFRGFWLADYFPELVSLDEAQMPPLSCFEGALGAVQVSPVLIPEACRDGFLAGYWKRPAAYLDVHVRAAMSSFWALKDVSHGLARLKSDLQTGKWDARYADLSDKSELDCGYRLVETL